MKKNIITKVCVITSTRADYGLLRWVMRTIKDDNELKLQTLVTGMHLSPEFGLTYKEIEQDGFYIDRKEVVTASLDNMTRPELEAKLKEVRDHNIVNGEAIDVEIKEIEDITPQETEE